MSHEIRTVAVVGAGTIGSSWTALFLAHGLRVIVCDSDPATPARVHGYIADSWLGLAQGLAGRGSDFSSAVERLEFSSIADLGATPVDLVQENGPESLEAKIAIYRDLEAVIPDDAIIASSSSGFPISRIQPHCVRPGRCIVAHPFNPPHIVPLVELSAGAATRADVVAACKTFYETIGKSVVVLSKELPGHIANRLQFALFREAVHLLCEGVASPTDIDRAVTDGPGLRWSMVGPFETFDLGGGRGGIAHFLDHLGGPIQTWWDDLGTPQLSSLIIEQIVDEYRFSSLQKPKKNVSEMGQAILQTLAVRERAFGQQ